MKILKSLVLISIITISSCAEEVKTSYTIKGDAKGIYNGIRVYLNEISERGRMMPIDTAIVMNESFLFEGSVDEPKLIYITVQSVPGRLPLMIENNVMELSINPSVLIESTATGSQTNDDFIKFKSNSAQLQNEINAVNNKYSNAKFHKDQELQESLKTELDALVKDFNTYPFEFIASHKSSYAAFQALETQLRNKNVDVNDLENSFNSLSKNLKMSNQGSSFKTKLARYKLELEQAKATDIGAKAPVFSAATPAGESLTLPDVYSKGKIP